MVSRIIEIVHFKENKPSSKFIVDSVEPSLKDNKYVQSGGFFLKVELEGQSMKLSIQEAEEIVLRLGMEVKRLVENETQMRIKQDASRSTKS